MNFSNKYISNKQLTLLAMNKSIVIGSTSFNSFLQFECVKVLIVYLFKMAYNMS